MKKITSIGIENKIHQFQYSFELDGDNITFNVYSIPKDEFRTFQYTFKIIDKNTAKAEMVTRNGWSEFSQKGLPEKIIQLASQILCRDIISSPLNPEAGNYLVGSSKKAWDRLVYTNKNAQLSDDEKHYIFKYVEQCSQ